MADRACQECRALISAFIDGEATREENARLRQHLATCADCQATLDSYRQIGGSIRAMPAHHTPLHLTEAIYAQTIDAEPRRLFLITSRLGYSLAAVASVLLIFVVAGYLIIGGYERSVDPTVASHEPVGQQLWPVHNPVRIEFNKEMDKESVVAALGILPDIPDEDLTLTWEGNTLVIGANPPFKPETKYEIKISTEATDKWGNRLSEPFQLGFTTTSSLATLQTPTTEAVLTPTSESRDATEPPSATPPPSATEPAAIATPRPGSNDDQPAVPTTTTNPAPGGGGESNDGTAVPNDPVDPTPTTPRPAPTATPTEPVSVAPPTETPAPSPTPTNTPSPPTATATTPPPLPTATATATTPQEPTVTATPEAIPVIGAIGDVYWRDQAVQDRLGAPLAAATEYGIDQLDFQGGVMLTNESRQAIYVLKFGGGWESHGIPDGERPEAVQVESGVYQPGGIFGALWISDPALQETVGLALNQYPLSYTGTVQLFQYGRMIATPSTVYVIYENFTWDWFSRSS